MKEVILHTGSNIGNRQDQLLQANQLISNHIGKIKEESAIYETQAWGITEQPAFLNQALLVNTALSPFGVLEQIQNIESIMGRIRKVKWGERCIDIDILFYGNEVIATPELTIPHPSLQDRNFVLVPLMDIAPNLIHPLLKKNIKTLYAESKDPLLVKAHISI